MGRVLKEAIGSDLIEIWEVAEEATAVWIGDRATFWLDEYGTAYGIASYGDHRPLHTHDPILASVVETLVALHYLVRIGAV